MRDQYAGDVSDFLKFGFLRALAGNDRTLGIAWYYAPGDDGRPDGRHIEWRAEPAFDPDASLIERASGFVDGLRSVPRVTARLRHDHYTL